MHSVHTQRLRLVVQLEHMLERPMVVLSFVWVLLAALEFMRGLSPLESRAVTVIWIIFIVDFLLKLLIAPRKLLFIRKNWIGALALLLPAFRLLRAARAFRAVRVLRGVRVAKLLGSLNRGMRALRRSMHRHGFGYVVALTLLVLFVGAAAMMAFEREGTNREAFATYSSSLWWTAMLITSLGSEHWPRTGAGRFVTLLIALYSFAVFGYITATLASFFIDQDERERKR